MATLTYVYADSTAVLGPLATYAEPHTYDLCADHATRLTAPRGWDIVRLAVDMTPPEPSPDDLVALADAVRQAAVRRAPEDSPAEAGPTRRPSRSVAAGDPATLSATERRRHLRVLPGQESGDDTSEGAGEARVGQDDTDGEDGSFRR